MAPTNSISGWTPIQTSSSPYTTTFNTITSSSPGFGIQSNDRWKCAHCIAENPRAAYAQPDAVTIIDGTAVCGQHASRLLTFILEEE